MLELVQTSLCKSLQLMDCFLILFTFAPDKYCCSVKSQYEGNTWTLKLQPVLSASAANELDHLLVILLDFTPGMHGDKVRPNIW